jgi:hypothetical protein
MAGITKVNPTATTLNYEVVGKDIQFFTIDYINGINGSAGPNGAQKAVLDTIATTATIIAAGPLVNSNTEQTFATEGADSVVAATLQAAVRALGTVDSVDLSGATVTDTKLGILTAAAVS